MDAFFLQNPDVKQKYEYAGDPAHEIPAYATIEKIAPDGDVILIIGTHRFALQVHSTIMKNASKVFASKLRAASTEGDRLEANSTKTLEVTLPSDDAQSFQTICELLHFCPGKEKPFTALDILHIGRTARKYQFVQALQYAAPMWISAAGAHASGSNLFLLAVSAILLEDHKGFSNTTSKLLWNYGAPFAGLSHGCDELGLKLAFALAESRAKCYHSLTRALSRYEACVHGNGKVLNGNTLRAAQRFLGHANGDPGKYKYDVIKEDIDKAFERIDTGLCLYCFVEDWVTASQTSCKGQHKIDKMAWRDRLDAEIPVLPDRDLFTGETSDGLPTASHIDDASQQPPCKRAKRDGEN